MGHLVFPLRILGLDHRWRLLCLELLPIFIDPLIVTVHFSTHLVREPSRTMNLELDIQRLADESIDVVIIK